MTTQRSHYNNRFRTDSTPDPKDTVIGGKTWSTPYQSPSGMHASSAYAATDAMGTSFAIEVPRSGLIHTAHCIDLAAQGAAFDVFLFEQRPAVEPTDDDPYDLKVETAIGYIGPISFAAANFVDGGSTVVATKENKGLTYIVPGANHAAPFYIHAQFVSRGTPTFSAVTDLRIRLVILAD